MIGVARVAIADVALGPWAREAACRGVGTDAMYPPPGNTAAVLAAQSVCGDCPVRRACLADALSREGSTGAADRYGIWGGATPQERRDLYLQHHPQAAPKHMPTGGGRRRAPCGTPAAYERHRRHGEPVDPACWAARKRPRTNTTKEPTP